jgi:hypothetical protein
LDHGEMGNPSIDHQSSSGPSCIPGPAPFTRPPREADKAPRDRGQAAFEAPRPGVGNGQTMLDDDQLLASGGPGINRPFTRGTV